MNPLDMSLDEIITVTKSNRSGQKRGRGGRTGGVSKRTTGTPYAATGKQARPVIPESAKIIISNLAPNVTQKDLTDLFSRVGSVRNASLNYDSNGKSKGNGTILFSTASDAAKAIREYHDRTFDGKPMKLELIIGAKALTGPASVASRLGAAPATASQKGRAGSKRGRGRGGKRAPQKTGEQLDADMDSYMKDEEMKDV